MYSINQYPVLKTSFMCLLSIPLKSEPSLSLCRRHALLLPPLTSHLLCQPNWLSRTLRLHHLTGSIHPAIKLCNDTTTDTHLMKDVISFLNRINFLYYCTHITVIVRNMVDHRNHDTETYESNPFPSDTGSNKRI